MSLIRFAALALLFAAAPLAAQPYGYHTDPAPPSPGANVKITAPWQGAIIEEGRPVVVDYDADPGGRGDHLHLYVDGRGPVILRQLAGSYRIGGMAPGRHTVTLALVTADHQPTGVEKRVEFRVAPPTPAAPAR
jgi:hypothetical protein